MGIVVSLTMDSPQGLHKGWAIHMVDGVHQGRLDTWAVCLRRQIMHPTTSGVLALRMDRLSLGTPDIVTSVVSDVCCTMKDFALGTATVDCRMLDVTGCFACCPNGLII